jgi:hypothetical protein
MDVSLCRLRARLFLPVFTVFGIFALFGGCGNRYDVNTPAGRQARIDDANYHLSKGECGLAQAAIQPVYASTGVTDDVRIIMAATWACYAGFNVLDLISQVASSTNLFQGLAASLSTQAGSGGPADFYAANDVLTSNGTALSAAARSQTVNAYMVFLELGTISAILRNYGSPSATGVKGQAISYPGQMSNVDACALAAAFSMLVDSFNNSNLSDATTAAAVAKANSYCVAAGQPSCNVINKDRTVCNGVNAQSTVAGAVVTGVNAAW